MRLGAAIVPLALFTLTSEAQQRAVQIPIQQFKLDNGLREFGHPLPEVFLTASRGVQWTNPLRTV